MVSQASFPFFDIAVVQSWILYRRTVTGNKSLKLREFKMNIADCLMRSGKSIVMPKRGRPSDVEKQLVAKRKGGPAAAVPTKAIRLDGQHHWPTFMEDDKKGRCKNSACDKITRVYCEKCKVNLCFTAKPNCVKLVPHEQYLVLYYSIVI